MPLPPAVGAAALGLIMSMEMDWCSPDGGSVLMGDEFTVTLSELVISDGCSGVT